MKIIMINDDEFDMAPCLYNIWMKHSFLLWKINLMQHRKEEILTFCGQLANCYQI